MRANLPTGAKIYGHCSHCTEVALGRGSTELPNYLHLVFTFSFLIVATKSCFIQFDNDFQSVLSPDDHK